MLRKRILFIGLVLCSLALIACEKGILSPVEPETSPSVQAPKSIVNEELNDFNGFKRGRSKRFFKFLKVSVAYLNPLSSTPDSLPIYRINHVFHYEIKIQNTSRSLKMKSLTVKVTQEYEKTGTCDRYWYQSPGVIDFKKGDILPGQSTAEFTNIAIPPGETVILKGSYHPPLQCCSAICQTHVEILLVPDFSVRNKRWKSKNEKKSKKSHELTADKTIQLLNESKAGIFYLKFEEESGEEQQLQEKKESEKEQQSVGEPSGEQQLEEKKESEKEQQSRVEPSEEQQLQEEPRKELVCLALYALGKKIEEQQLQEKKESGLESSKIPASEELKKGIALFKNNYMEEAKEIFKKEIAKNPENWCARNYLSKIYIKEKKYDEAIKEINKAVEDFKKRHSIQ